MNKIYYRPFYNDGSVVYGPSRVYQLRELQGISFQEFTFAKEILADWCALSGRLQRPIRLETPFRVLPSDRMKNRLEPSKCWAHDGS
jgi:hypothetical protein